MLKSDVKHLKSEIFSKQGAIKKLTDKYVFCWWPRKFLIRALRTNEQNEELQDVEKLGLDDRHLEPNSDLGGQDVLHRDSVLRVQ